MVCAGLLCGCAQAHHAARSPEPKLGDPALAPYLADLKTQYQNRPADLELLLTIRRLENAAVDYYLVSGLSALSQENYSAAREHFRSGLSVVPDHPKLLAELRLVDDREEATALFTQARAYYQERQLKSSLEAINGALRLSPQDVALQEFARRVESEYRRYKRDQYKIDLKFSEIDVKDAYRFIAKNFGVNLVFDPSVKEGAISLDMADVSFVDAIELLSQITHNRFKVLDPRALVIYADTKQKQEEYRDVRVQSFVLETIPAKDMAGILKSVLSLKDITINESANTLIVSATGDELQAVADIIQENDVSPGEVLLNVEILEINVNDAQRLGVNFGDYRLSTTTPSIPISDSIRDSYNAVTTLNIPSVTLDAFKQAVAAKSLAQPSIRVLDGEKAKIHIGDRVPLRKSSIQDATGQTRTTFEYQEIGIRFNVEANIHAGDKITVKLNLEVSSLGENLGTPTEQAYRIGTRNADTTMLINNGETVILGGLLREEGRSTRSSIYGMDNVPVAGDVLASRDNSQAQTDVLLTVTPQIVRNLKRRADMAATAAGEYLRPSELDELKLSRATRPVVIGEQQTAPTAVIGNEQDSDSLAPDGAVAVVLSAQSAQSTQTPQGPAAAPVLNFHKDLYSGELNQSHQVVLQLDAAGLEQMDLDIKVNANIVGMGKYSLLDGDWQLVGEKETSAGQLRITVARSKRPDRRGPEGATDFLSIDIEPKRKGTSFIVGKLEVAQPAGMAQEEKILPASAKFRVD